MAQSSWSCRLGQCVAVRGAALGAVPGYVLGPAGVRGWRRRPAVALAINASHGDEWIPFVARPGQILMPWGRWCAVRRAAVQAQRTVMAGAGRRGDAR